MVAAQGVMAAIGQALGGKKSKAMAAFRKGLGGGSGASASDSGEMSRLRDRIRGVQKIVGGRG